MLKVDFVAELSLESFRSSRLARMVEASMSLVSGAIVA